MAPFLLAGLLSLALTPLTILLARRLGVLDVPGPRSMHQRPVPRLGGAAVFAAASAAAALYGPRDLASLSLGASGALVYALGAWDDARPLSPGLRLAVQAAAAALAVGGGLRPAWPGGLPGALLAWLWLIGMANAYNFLDGIDGLAAGLGVAGGLALGGPAGLALAGACAGFLPYNWRPARVFLGDGGATFLGFWLGGLGLLAVRGGPASWPPVLLVFVLPLADMAWTTARRRRAGLIDGVGSWLAYAGKDHVHHVLVERGLSVPQAAALLILASAALGAVGAVWRG